MKSADCDPKEIGLKSFFLGPQAENALWIGELLVQCFQEWTSWRRSLYVGDGSAISEQDLATPEFLERKKNIENAVADLIARFGGELPKHSPRYMGHMCSEVSIPALLGHIVTLFFNPNNISGESSRIGVGLEVEAVQYLLKMVGYDHQAQGHFTSGGTIANFEALVRARARSALWLTPAAEKNNSSKKHLFQDAHMGWEEYLRHPRAPAPKSWNYAENPWIAAPLLGASYGVEFRGSVVLVPENKHYSWVKGCSLLGFGSDALWPIRLDRFGRMSVTHLRELVEQAALKKIPIALMVSVVGSTEMGSIDPVHEVERVREEWRTREGVHLWHHVDAAYGGFLCSMKRLETQTLSPQSVLALTAISGVTSVTLDPHKLGYVPYASGAFLVGHANDYYCHQVTDAPYLDFEVMKDKGPFTIEGSRSAAGAVATWMTAKTMGLDESGYGMLLERTVRIAHELVGKMKASGLSIQIAPGLDSNLVCFCCAKPGEGLSKSNARTLRVYRAFSPQGQNPFVVSKTTLSGKSYGDYLDRWVEGWSGVRDVDEVLLIRMSVMNPFLGSKQMKVNFLDEFIDELRKIFALEAE